MGSNIALQQSSNKYLLQEEGLSGCPEEEGRTRPIPFKVNLHITNVSITCSTSFVGLFLHSKYI